MPVVRKLSMAPVALVLGLVASVAPAPARADDAPVQANVAAARRHYDKARAFYEQGAYHDAVAELEAAHALDPSAKDLVFNLGVVHEKLGDIDDALQWLRLYATMNLLPQERERAEAYVRRLEGAKRSLEQDAGHKGAADAPPAPPASPSAGSAAPASPSPASSTAAPAPVRPSRVDLFTLATGGIAAVGLLAGITLGIKALADQPGSSFVTGRDGSYDDLLHQVDVAHTEAVAADVAFGIAAVAGLGCAYFYWLSPRPTATVGVTSVSATPTATGVAFTVRGLM